MCVCVSWMLLRFSFRLLLRVTFFVWLVVSTIARIDTLFIFFLIAANSVLASFFMLFL